MAREAATLPRRLFPDREPTVLTLDGGVTLRTWPMEHTNFAPVLGLRVEHAGRAVAFTGDTAPCANVVPLARGADLLFHEASYCATLDPELHDGLHGHSTAARRRPRPPPPPGCRGWPWSTCRPTTTGGRMS